jgi:two-component system CheB/CheR fusion protein
MTKNPARRLLRTQVHLSEAATKAAQASDEGLDACVPAAKEVPLVGVGASAGGLTALKLLLPKLQPATVVAYVVVQHLDANHDSLMAELLSHSSRLPVVEISDGTVIEPGCIYVMPNNVTVTVKGNCLLLAPRSEHPNDRTPIDRFLLSLAESRGEESACVILSGTGSDGTIGLRAIKESGGLTIAQEGAEYDGMMRSAVATGMVDYIIPLEEIGRKVDEYFHRRDAFSSDDVQDNDRVLTYRGQILELLQQRTGHDFSGYKTKTVSRRIKRRMHALQLTDFTVFVARLRTDQNELNALLQDLLISVTNFFRDPAVFEMIGKQIIPRLLSEKGAGDSVRVWVAGCATGEEAYSIAILFLEHLGRGKGTPKLQIFASDINEHALQVARSGRYPATVTKDIPAKLLKKYFVREDGTYRVVSELREACMFSSHNVLRDPPFSKLDMISCRNLLIYMTPELQYRLIPVFHYALKEQGYLLLGNSENISRHTRLFSTFDKGNHVFSRRPRIDRELPKFPLMLTSESFAGSSDIKPLSGNQTLQMLAEGVVLKSYAPAYVLINLDGEVLLSSGRTGRYLELVAGTPKLDIFGMARPGLRSELRSGLQEAVSTNQIVIRRDFVIEDGELQRCLDLSFHPVRSRTLQSPLYLVVFLDKSAKINRSTINAGALVFNSSLEQLEAELLTARERLQTTAEELESANEELKSGNEEFSSMNEELQSTNEELETSKEELQSINEELQIVNGELNSRIEQLSHANSDIANLLESTQIATLFLDRNLQVKSFTPASRDLFRLVDSDVGRPISHVRTRFQPNTLEEDAARVLQTLGAVESQVECSDDNAHYVMRTMPYRTVDKIVAGVVITFIDITEISRAEARITELTRDLRVRIRSLETLLDVVPVGILIIDDNRQLDQVQVNRYGAGLLDGVERNGKRGLRVVENALQIFQEHQELPLSKHPLRLAAQFGVSTNVFEGQLVQSDVERVDVMVTASPLTDEGGRVYGGIAAIVDISDRKNAEVRQQALLYELQHRVKNIIATISAVASRTLKGDVSVGQLADSFQGRLRGMAATHELLSRSNWQGASLGALVGAALRPHLIDEGGNVTMEGPDILVSPQTSDTLGMVFYELTTNASKYGALSHEEGRLKVSWDVQQEEAGGKVTVVWTEVGGLAYAEGTAFGFGARFISRSVEYELRGSARIESLPTGLSWTLTFPLRPHKPELSS